MPSPGVTLLRRRSVSRLGGWGPLECRHLRAAVAYAGALQAHRQLVGCHSFLFLLWSYFLFLLLRTFQKCMVLSPFQACGHTHSGVCVCVCAHTHTHTHTRLCMEARVDVQYLQMLLCFESRALIERGT